MRPPALVLPALAGLLLTACSSGSAGPTAAGGPVMISASDTACELDRTELSAGRNVLSISNSGSEVTEVYVYDGDRIVTEKENIGPGTSYELTVQLAEGSYEVACKPGQSGDGIRTPITVAAPQATGTALQPSAVEQAAVARYRAYVQQQVDAAVPLAQDFAAALKADDVAGAKQLYATSRVPWERIEPVAESFGDIDPKVDLREADLAPGQTWTGWHRLEKALWVTGSTTGTGPVADQLVADLQDLRRRVPDADITVASIGNGAKELLDEVASGKITGEEEAFSHTDLVDVRANVDGAREAFDALRPLLAGEASGLTGRLAAAFAAMDAALEPYTDGDGYVAYDTVDAAGRRALAQAADGLGEPLSQLSSAALA